MDLSHISQDKILPEVDLVSHEDDKSETFSSIQDLEVFQSLRKHYCFFLQRLVSSVEHGTSTSGVRCCYGLVSLLALGEFQPDWSECREFAYSCDEKRS